MTQAQKFIIQHKEDLAGTLAQIFSQGEEYEPFVRAVLKELAKTKSHKELRELTMGYPNLFAFYILKIYHKV